MQKSASIANLAVALSKAQAEMPVAIFDARNPFLKNKYATLGQVISTSKPVLSKHGLAISQFPASNVVNGTYMVGITSILMHETGEWIEETCLLVPEKNKGVSDAQAAGIAITYCRRYSWASIAAMYSDEDTDAESIDGSESAATNNAVTKIMADPKTGEIEIKRVWSIDQMEAIIEKSEGTVDDHEVATRILNLSALPENAPVGTIKSWMGHYIKSSGDTEFTCAADANKAYAAAKKKK